MTCFKENKAVEKIVTEFSVAKYFRDRFGPKTLNIQKNRQNISMFCSLVIFVP